MADAVVRLRVESSEYDQKLSRATQQLQHMEKEVRRTGATFAYADKEELEFIKSLGSMETKTTSAKSQLREYTEALMQMTSTYRNLTQEEKNSDWGKALAASMDEIKGKAAMLRDAMADVNREIGGMASDTQVFDQIAGGVTGLVSVFQVGQGALQMFGVKSNEAMQAMAKLQGAMAVANGLTKIQSALQKESNLMQGVAKVQRLAAAAAQEMETKAMTGNVAATKAATVAQKALNAVAKANPFLLLASAIGAVVGALAIFSGSASKAAQDQKKLAESVGTSMGKMMTTYTTLQNEWKNLSTEQEKSDWIDENRDKFNELGIAVNSVADAQKVLVDQSEKVVQAFELQAKAAALQSLAEEKYKDYYERLAKNKDKMVQAGQKVSDIDGYSLSAGEMSAMALQGYMKSEGFLGTGGFTWTEKGAEMVNKGLLGTGEEEAKKLLEMEQEVKKELEDIWKDIDVKTTDDVKINVKVQYDEGELGQLQQKLAELRQEQQHAIDNAEFNVIQKDIDAVQKQIDAITGKTDKKVTKDITPLQDAQKKIAELTNEALTADEERREAIRLEIEDLQKQVEEYKKIQDYVQGIKKDEEPKEIETTMSGPSMSAFEKLQQSIRIKLADDASSIDTTSLNNLLSVAIQNGIDSLNPNFEELMYKMGEGFDIPDEAWEELAAQINEKLANLGLDPIELDVKTGNVKELDNQIGSLETNLNGAIGVFGQLGDAMQQIEDPGAKVAGIIMGAIANIAGTFAKSLGGTFTPWDWIAAAISGTATMISTIAAIKSATSGRYANGGKIPGNSFSGDNMRGMLPSGEMVGLDAGELILNRAQQGSIAGQLNSNPMGNLRLSTEISGSNRRVVLNNDKRQRGGSRDVYGVH